jgi:CheY-like chemotaxis protein
MDDEKLIRDLVTELLESLGYDAHSVRDGAEAIDAFHRALGAGKPFHVVILDLTVPGGMGGKETLVRLRQIDTEFRSIVSSGYSNDRVMSDYAQYGFDGVLRKPYDIQDVENLLNELLAGMSRTLPHKTADGTSVIGR